MPHWCTHPQSYGIMNFMRIANRFCYLMCTRKHSNNWFNHIQLNWFSIYWMVSLAQAQTHSSISSICATSKWFGWKVLFETFHSQAKINFIVLFFCFALLCLCLANVVFMFYSFCVRLSFVCFSKIFFTFKNSIEHEIVNVIETIDRYMYGIIEQLMFE